tara:strand:- start:1102 stop:1428 length:327 start_codon:yes stop_codon:yes gene_type:complete
MLLNRFLNSLEKQWLGIIVIAVWLFVYSSNKEKTNLLLEQTNLLESKIEMLELKADKSKKVIDSLYRADSLIVTRIKIIKQKEYVQVKIIDSLPISGLQKFFSDRYPK